MSECHVPLKLMQNVSQITGAKFGMFKCCVVKDVLVQNRCLTPENVAYITWIKSKFQIT